MASSGRVGWTEHCEAIVFRQWEGAARRSALRHIAAPPRRPDAEISPQSRFNLATLAKAGGRLLSMRGSALLQFPDFSSYTNFIFG
jgi:hypothetical protein